MANNTLMYNNNSELHRMLEVDNFDELKFDKILRNGWNLLAGKTKSGREEKRLAFNSKLRSPVIGLRSKERSL